MPEHVAIKYDQPGKCPICGMTLVPVNAATLAKLQPGGRVLSYTCPMPEHSDVNLDKPGKCPKSAMTLIPVMEPPSVSEEREASERKSVAVSPTLHAPNAARSTFYTCPMAEHADVISDIAGKCPKCEMDLVPTTTVKHGKVAEENWRKQQTLEHKH